MRAIIEIIVAITVLAGGGQWVLQKAAYRLKKAVAEKIQEQGATRLGDYTREMTGSDTGL
jgi:hypothetical protein